MTARLLRRILNCVLLVCLIVPVRNAAAEFAEAQRLFLSGKYEAALALADEGVSSDRRNEEWPLLQATILNTLGRYDEAALAVKEGLKVHYYSIRLRLAAYEALRYNGPIQAANQMLEEINYFAGNRMWAYRTPPNQVALGKAAVYLGADARRVLDHFFEPAKAGDPDFRGGHLAAGHLALDKSDFALASKLFQAAAQRFPADPDMRLGLARAFGPADRQQMLAHAAEALEINPRHLPSLSLVADHLIDAEEYSKTEETLAEIFTVNPWHPEAWSYQAVLEHLRSNAKGEARSREMALRHRPRSPLADHLIGKKLSQKYRFAEGAAYQRAALRHDPVYLPAQIQLAQDLLRLGDEDEGWKLADLVHRSDPYDIHAYNLVTLHESLSKFDTLTNGHFVVRMRTNEAALYGREVLDLLRRAEQDLCARYGAPLTQPVLVEIFPEQKDFGVRTFGMPDNPGYLGVCFGSVITANSPASQAGAPANWHAVLWHEFCHVITLSLTHNKMPRWLSEGVSVYEESRANPVWGQSMNPRYREMIIEGELTPVGEMSGAFLTPKTDFHLQFAYFQAYLVVDFLVQKFGFDSLTDILRDLADGDDINDAIARHTAPMDVIEREFLAFAKEQANLLAPGLKFDNPKKTGGGPGSFLGLPGSVGSERTPKEWIEAEPDNFYALTARAKELVRNKSFEEAKPLLRKLIDEYPAYAGSDNAYLLLAEAHRGLAETSEELAALSKLAGRSAEATDVYLRVMELALDAKDWREVARNAERFLAVNPLLPAPYRVRAQAAEALGDPVAAIDSYEKLLLLDPPDPSAVHFKLAELLPSSAALRAKRHVLRALEEAPRFREAHKLLIDLDQAIRSATPR